MRSSKALLRYDGFDPRHHRTQKAYRAWRRKVIAAAKHATGVKAAARARRERRDGFHALLETLAPYTEAPVGTWLVAPQQLIPIRNLADEARRRGLDLGQLTPEVLLEIHEGIPTGSRRDSIETAGGFLDWARFLPDVAALLPACDLRFDPPCRRRRRCDLPEGLEAQVEGWIVGATHFDYDHIAQEYTKILKGAAERMRSATRTFLGTAARCGALILRRIDDLASAFAPEVLRHVVRAWTDEDRPLASDLGPHRARLPRRHQCRARARRP